MQAETVRCNSCGAALTVGPQARFVTCQYCHCQLEIKRNDSAIFTEEIARIAHNTDQMAESLEVIKLQNEIEMLDRAAATRSMYEMSAQNSGGKSGPGGVLGLAFGIFFAVVCFSMAVFTGKNGAPGLFTLVPIGMGIFGLVSAFAAYGKSMAQTQQRDDFQARRQALVQKLEALKSQSDSPPGRAP